MSMLSGRFSPGSVSNLPESAAGEAPYHPKPLSRVKREALPVLSDAGLPKRPKAEPSSAKPVTEEASLHVAGSAVSKPAPREKRRCSQLPRHAGPAYFGDQFLVNYMVPSVASLRAAHGEPLQKIEVHSQGFRRNESPHSIRSDAVIAYGLDLARGLISVREVALEINANTGIAASTAQKWFKSDMPDGLSPYGILAIFPSAKETIDSLSAAELISLGEIRKRENISDFGALGAIGRPLVSIRAASGLLDPTSTDGLSLSGVTKLVEKLVREDVRHEASFGENSDPLTPLQLAIDPGVAAKQLQSSLEGNHPGSLSPVSVKWPRHGDISWVTANAEAATQLIGDPHRAIA